MSNSTVERRLAAILVADVVGYSRLMGADEEGTLAAFKRCRSEVIDPKIAEHGGRIVKTTGDGLLIEYPSVLEAVRCAIEMQTDIAAHTRDQPAEKRLNFRIGINLGDVIIDEDDIFGDGVNVAARLEGLAEPGGVAISGAVYDQVRNKLDIEYQNLGEQSVKNIAEPVRVYKVISEGDSGGAVGRLWPVKSLLRYKTVSAAMIVVAAVAAIAIIAWWVAGSRPGGVEQVASSKARKIFPLPDKPSIAVLPFDNLSGDIKQAYLGDGLAENIISSLSKISKMFVIARNSAFTYKGKAVKVQQVAEELGVRYVLEGSVQKSGEKLRVTAKLIDARTGFHLWSERYDRDKKELFALQDEITLNIVAALQIKLTEGEMARVRRRGTDNLEALLLVTQSMELFQRFNKEDNARARELAQKAIKLDPKYTDAYVRLARTYLTDFQAGWVQERAAAFKRSVELGRQALALDDAYADTYNLLGAIYLFVNRHDEAIAFAEKAVQLSPNFAIAKASLGMVQTYAGQPEAAITTLQSAMRLSPFYPDWFLGELGRAYFQTGRYDEAIEALKQRLRRNPKYDGTFIMLAATYGASGRVDQARVALATFLKHRPYYTLRHYAEGEFYKNPDDLKRVLDALRRAGLDE